MIETRRISYRTLHVSTLLILLFRKDALNGEISYTKIFLFQINAVLQTFFSCKNPIKLHTFHLSSTTYFPLIKIKIIVS